MFKNINLLFLLLYSCTAFGQEWFDTRAPELLQIRKVIFNACPPSACHYIGIGASATPVTAFLRASLTAAEASNLVTDIPSSGLQHYFAPENLQKMAVVHERFDKIFDTFLMADRIEGKRIVLIDTCVSGSSLAAVHDELKRYLSKRRINAEVEIHGLGYDSSVPKIIKSRKGRVTASKLVGDLLFTNIRSRFRKFEKASILGEEYRTPKIDAENSLNIDVKVEEIRGKLLNKPDGAVNKCISLLSSVRKLLNN